MKLKHFLLIGLLDAVGIVFVVGFFTAGIIFFIKGNDARCIEFFLFGLGADLVSNLLQNGISGYLKAREQTNEEYRERYKKEREP